MSNLPTFSYPYVIQKQINKTGKWSSFYSIKSTEDMLYVKHSLLRTKQLFPQDNFRVLLLKIIGE